MEQKPTQLTKTEAELRDKIVKSMVHNGFKVNPHLRLPNNDKDTLKSIQNNAKVSQIAEHRNFLMSFFNTAKEFCSDGSEIVPEDIRLELREVRPDSLESKLFRWWNLAWWSMPYQRAYGRQIRFVIWDVAHDNPFGLILLQSPLLRMKARDNYLELPRESLDHWANMSMNAQRIGALPPYNNLIGGKLAALAMTSNEVRRAYRKKYSGKKTLMKKRTLKPDLLFLTTTSAFGKSSMYDRLKYKEHLAAIPIGYTQGTGTFHMSESLTREVYAMLQKRNVNTATGYGHGPSRKIKLFKKAFSCLGLKDFYAHGILREVYFFPLAKNLPLVIHENKRPMWHDRPFQEIAEYWKARWALPRSRRMPQWKEFDSKEFFRGVRTMLRV